MPAPVRTVVSEVAEFTADVEKVPTGLADDAGRRQAEREQRSQASTQAPSWRARPSTSSRRRLTAATRIDHHSWLRSTPR
jgi:hypothetical protein